jgi:hypothetical protein
VARVARRRQRDGVRHALLRQPVDLRARVHDSSTQAAIDRSRRRDTCMAAAIERLRSLIYERIGGGTRSLRAKAHSSGTFLRWLASSAVLSADSDGRLLKRKCDHLFQRDVRSFFFPRPDEISFVYMPPHAPWS